MNKWRQKVSNCKARLTVALVALTPLLARADWGETVNGELRKVRIALYLITGTVAVGTLIYKGAQWLIARSQGDHSITAMDYGKQVAVIVAVGGAVALATYAWGVFGTGTID